MKVHYENFQMHICKKISYWGQYETAKNLFDNSRNITRGKDIKTTGMIPIFLYTFFRLPVCDIYFWIWNSFSCGSPFGPFFSVKYRNFSPTATYLNSSSYFSRKRHPEVTKNPYYVLFNCRRQIPICLGPAYGL